MLESNPYELKVKKWRKRRRMLAVAETPLEIIDKSTGEIKGATPLVCGDRFRDTTDFIKIYEPKLLMNLSKAGSNMLFYVMSRMNFQGFAEFTYDQAKEDTGYKTNKSIYDGLIELVEKDIIRPKDEGGYWINPNIMYRGARTGFEIDETESSDT